MKTVYIREATPDDYEQVIAMREVPKDYLKDYYHIIMRTHKGYVAVDNNEIVGFVFVRLLDNGLSVVSRAGRVREDYEGRGIQKQLVAHVLQIYSPPARFQVATFRDTNEYLMQKRNTGQLNISFHRENQVFLADVRQLSARHINETYYGIIKCVQEKDLEEIFASKELRRILFPKDMLVSFKVPLRAMKENIGQLLAEEGLLLGSNISTEDDHSKAMLSIGHAFSCELGCIYDIDIYGTNTEQLHNHLVWHLSDVMPRCTGEHLLFEIFPEPTIRNEIEKVMFNLGFKKHNWDVASAMYCYDVDLKSRL